MTPNQPPAEPQGTPNQPPPVQPAQPAQPAAQPEEGRRHGRDKDKDKDKDRDGDENEEHGDAPPARTGFQVALRSGVAIPLGDVQKDLKLSDVAGPQFAATVDIGGKIIPNLFVGGYLGLNIGGAGGTLADSCTKASASCTAVTLRIGVQAQYHIIPDGKVNPWVGYGIGYEATSINESVGGLSVTTTAGGLEFGHIMGGVDFRISKVFGLGPFVDLSVAQYSSYDTGSSSVNGTSTSHDIQNKALHEWLTLGAKFVFFP